MSLSFDAATHTYHMDGVKIPSVTQVIKSAGLSDYSHVPPDALAQKAQLGRDAHEATALHDQRDLEEESVSEAVQPYLDAWRMFLRDMGLIEIRLIETPLGSSKHRFAGTIDRLARVGGIISIIDIKTGAAEEWHKIQLAAYAVLLREAGHKPAYGYNIYLNRLGGYSPMRHRLSNLKAEESCFLSALNVWKWKQIKGYYNGKS